MNTKEFLIELWRIWVARRLSTWAASLFIVSGIGVLIPQWWHGLANALYYQVTQSNLEPFEVSFFTGWGFIGVGLALIVLSIWEGKRTRNKEIVGIRHVSLGKFPPEAIKPDLPYIQKLWHYRELDVDHGGSYTGGVLADHDSIMRRLERVPDQLDGILQVNSETLLVYYGLSHIPLALYLGFLLSDNKYHIEQYELNNESGRWNQLSGKPVPLNLKTNSNLLKESSDSGNVIITIGISYPIHTSEIEEVDIDNELGRVNIEVSDPQRQLICSSDQIEQVCMEFRRSLERVKSAYPNRNKTHIFYSGPVSLAFALGRVISERIDSEICVYNYSSKELPKYSWSLSFNGSSPASISPTNTQGEERVTVQHA